MSQAEVLHAFRYPLSDFVEAIEPDSEPKGACERIELVRLGAQVLAPSLPDLAEL